MKKIISVVLMTAMLLSLVVFSVSADLAGAGTEASPYLIGTKADLEAFAAAPVDGAHYKLTADIVWSDYKQGGTAPDASNWTPITFNGTFDGDGHTVSGLYVNTPDVSYVGFFAKANGVVKNLTVKDSTFIGKSYVSGIVAGMSVSADKNAPATITIENCVNYADVTGSVKDSFAGGVAGGLWASPANDNYIAVTVVKCVNYGDITSVTGNAHVGGVVGRIIGMPGIVDQCANFGDVTGASALAGGVIGQVGRDKETFEGFTYTISNCYNAGTVTATEVNGGIVSRGYAPITIENCVNVGDVIATKDGGKRFGPIDGNNASTVKNSFYLEGCAKNSVDATLAGTGMVEGATAKTLAEINSAATAAALGDKWEYNETDGLTLKFLATPKAPAEPETPVNPQPPVDPEPTPNPGTGDATVVLAIVCIVATAGVVFSAKKREER